MSAKTIALYATNTMADWEYAYLTTLVARAEQTVSGRFTMTVVGDGVEPVTSLGRLPITPTRDVADLLDDDSLAALVIPGADTYATGHDRLAHVARQLVERGRSVAAICGATFLLARTGLIDDRRHTSNDPEFLSLTGYRGGAQYEHSPAVTDRGVTTSSGLYPVQFTAEVARQIGLYPSHIIDAWEMLYLRGEAKYYHQLVEATDAWQNA